MDLSLISKELKEHIAGVVDAKTGDEVQYIDVNNPDHFVPMPKWFEDITTIPGIPFKFLTEFVGKPDSGKTTAGMIALINAQKSGCITVLVDAERKFSYTRFKKMGGDPETLYIIQQPSIEQSFNNLEKLLKLIDEKFPGQKVLIVYDSIAIGVTMAELGKAATDSQTIADQAKVIKRMIRRIIYYLQECNTALIVINQMYKDPSPMAHGANRISGGQGVEYGKALSLSFAKKKDLLKTKDKVEYKVGILTELKSSKNHILDGDMRVSKIDIEVVSDDMRRASDTKKRGKKNQDEDIPAELDDNDTDSE